MFVIAAVACYALATVAHALLEKPGLGLSHLFYLPIALVALATDWRIGAAAGVLAGGLYALCHLLNADLESQNVLTVATVIRLGAYVATGALIGWFAHGNRELVGVEYWKRDADGSLATDNDRPSLFGRAFDGPMPGHNPTMPVHYDLHVWLWRANPAGVYSPTNAAVKCPKSQLTQTEGHVH